MHNRKKRLKDIAMVLYCERMIELNRRKLNLNRLLWWKQFEKKMETNKHLVFRHVTLVKYFTHQQLNDENKFFNLSKISNTFVLKMPIAT